MAKERDTVPGMQPWLDYPHKAHYGGTDTHTWSFQPPSLQSPDSRSAVNKREQSQNRGFDIFQDMAGYSRHGFLNTVTMGKRKEEEFSELLIVFLSFKARIHISGGFYMCCAYADYEKPDLSKGNGEEKLPHIGMKAQPLLGSAGQGHL